MFTKAFWLGATERAVKTLFQTFVALVGTSVLITDVEWTTVLSGSILAAVLSIATSLGNADFTAGSSDTEIHS